MRLRDGDVLTWGWYRPRAYWVRLRRLVRPDEQQTCPRRAEGGPWSMEEDQDRWVTGRWLPDNPLGRLADRWHRWLYTKTGGSAGSQVWPGPGPAPRTCSFCGGAHPADVTALILEHGWEVEPTTKWYKRYIQPPGYASHIDRLLGHMREHFADREGWPEGPRVPLPPVKVYVPHFDEDQRLAFNAALAQRGER